MEKDYEIQIDKVEAFKSARFPTNTVVNINWDSTEGFGQLGIIINESGKVFIDTEYMGREFAKQVLNKLVDDAEVEYKD
jgi:hypothetical protein